jgi:ribosomal protein L7/L12
MTAKTMVDRIEAAANRPRATGVPGDNVPSASPIPLDVELEVRGLKAQGDQIAAIKLIREHTGLGLQDAKDYVDSL